MDKNECRCPVCGDKLIIHKEAQNGGMDGRYYDWVIECQNCHLIHIEYAADCFYGREYYETPEDAMGHLKEYISMVRKRIQNAIEEKILYGEQNDEGTESVKPVLDFDGKDVWRCGKCGATIFHPENTQADEDEKNYNKYCRKCGREVKWNDEAGSNRSN